MKIIKEYNFEINNILFEYSVIQTDNCQEYTAWCTSDDTIGINSNIPYFQSPHNIINYLKKIGISKKDLIEIERITFRYLT